MNCEETLKKGVKREKWLDHFQCKNYSNLGYSKEERMLKWKEYNEWMLEKKKWNFDEKEKCIL